MVSANSDANYLTVLLILSISLVGRVNYPLCMQSLYSCVRFCCVRQRGFN